MSEKADREGPRSGAGRPAEQEAVVTTIVGGRPPGSGQPVGSIPRAIEVLVKKAAVDPEFKSLLLERRAEAAGAIGLELDPAEAMMLRAVPADQLEAIIARTEVPQEHRRAFLGNAAAVMLAALGLAIEGCTKEGPVPAPTGIAPDRPPAPKGIAPDRPPPVPEGIRPDRPENTEKTGPSASPVTEGIRPDVPKKAESPPPPPRGIRPDVPEKADRPTTPGPEKEG